MVFYAGVASGTRLLGALSHIGSGSWPNSLRRLVTLSLGRRSLLEHGGRRPPCGAHHPKAAPGGAAPGATEVLRGSARAVGGLGGVRAAVLGREMREMVVALGAVGAPSPAATVAGSAAPASGLGRRLSVSGAQIVSLGAAFGGLAGGFEGAGATAQDERERPGPWLWQGWPRGAAAGEGGRRVNRLEGTGGEGGSDGDGGA